MGNKEYESTIVFEIRPENPFKGKRGDEDGERYRERNPYLGVAVADRTADIAQLVLYACLCTSGIPEIGMVEVWCSQAVENVRGAARMQVK